MIILLLFVNIKDSKVHQEVIFEIRVIMFPTRILLQHQHRQRTLQTTQWRMQACQSCKVTIAFTGGLNQRDCLYCRKQNIVGHVE